MVGRGTEVWSAPRVSNDWSVLRWIMCPYFPKTVRYRVVGEAPQLGILSGLNQSQYRKSFVFDSLGVRDIDGVESHVPIRKIHRNKNRDRVAAVATVDRSEASI